jgi:hypothetical protein
VYDRLDCPAASDDHINDKVAVGSTQGHNFAASVQIPSKRHTITSSILGRIRMVTAGLSDVECHMNPRELYEGQKA